VPVSRRNQVYPEITPYYHCISRCVRRAWLCGEDGKTGRNFGHRKAWIEKRLLFLSQVFAIDLTAYAVMSNHYHVVLHLDPPTAAEWSVEEVIDRWGRVCRLPGDAQTFLSGGEIQPCQHADLMLRVNTWRERLGSMSWFMRFVNEPLARLANREDDCTGRFWEGRFKSQALLDETAVITCMAYVDLNPVRARVAQTPEASAHTSIRRRAIGRDRDLQPFANDSSTSAAPRYSRCLPIGRASYFEIVDWSSRVFRTATAGRIPDRAPHILERLGGRNAWLRQMKSRTRRGTFVGPVEILREICDAVGRRWLWGSGRVPIDDTAATFSIDAV